MSAQRIKGGPTTKFHLGYVNGKLWDVVGGFEWQFRDGTSVCVPDLFRHDFNSVPWILRRVLPPTEWGEAGTIHDWLYRNCGKVEVTKDGKLVWVQWTREECDKRYLEILEDLGAPAVKRSVMFTGVRSGGWRAWGQHSRRIAKEAGIKPSMPRPTAPSRR